MSRKPYRFGLLIIGLLVTAALGYRAVADASSLGRASREGVALDRAADQALEALLTLRASLHAYVAPGQGVPFWSARAGEAINGLHEHLATLDAAVSKRGGSLSKTLDAVDQLAAAERRTREYARRGEALLAGDVVFSEVRNLMTASLEEIRAARSTLAAAHEAEVSSLRSEQAMLAAIVVVTWVAIALLLVPPIKEVAVKDPNEWLKDLAVTIKKPIPKDPESAKLKPVEQVETPAPLPAPPVAPVVPVVPLKAVQDVSEICSDLSTLADLGALAGALDRAATALDASGVIVWVASNDGSSLAPVASHGFDETLVSRIGRIPRDSNNLTAAAFRENLPRVSTATTPAALAVALCGPTGAVGVLSIELKPGVPADETRVALATIFAAQLATLANPMSYVAPEAPAVSDAAPELPRARVAL